MDRARAAEILGVDVTASPEQVRAAFRRRARTAHPDAVGGSTAAMVELNAAYETLTSPAGPDWEFAGSTATAPPWWIDDRLDEPSGPPAPGQSVLRWFGIALAVVAVLMTTIVFIAAIGYDWSLSP